MKKMIDLIEAFGGLASRGELQRRGIDPGLITLAARSGRHIIRVRKGWYALATEEREIVRAWRVGGRLSCVSSIALFEGVEMPVLHVEVPANTARLRDPDHPWRALSPDAPVLVHWTRHPGPGDRRSVYLEHALDVAEACGAHSAGVVRERV
ncbi:MAG TPA: type IV toxin-antitoxin system AbiEi family antitoxin domain-containing protein [Pseudolysinimonas sp.]|nr:type IV toxin-antitoxin system AbiEi family antitoxin domain-containing protein [Pseudolysinimonas sp.]